MSTFGIRIIVSRLYFSPNVFLVEFLSRLILLSANLQGLIAPFPGGTHDWLAREVSFTVPTGQTATKLDVYTIYKNDPITSGVVYFDDIEIIVIPPAPREDADGWKALDNVKFLEGNTFSIDKHGVKLHNGYVIADRVPINDNQIESEGVWTMKNQKKNWIRCSYFKPELWTDVSNSFDYDSNSFEEYRRKCTDDDKLVEGTRAEPEKHAVKCCSSKKNTSKGGQTFAASSAEENVALGKQTKVSSTYQSLDASFALDGNPDTFFHSDKGDNEYFQVDLGQNYRVGR